MLGVPERDGHASSGLQPRDCRERHRALHGRWKLVLDMSSSIALPERP